MTYELWILVVFPVFLMLLLQALIALSARSKWWKDKGYKLSLIHI